MRSPGGSTASWLRHLIIVAFTGVILAAVVVLGQVPLGRGSGQARLRLALRTVLSNAEICTDRTSAELEALPQHMRQARVCEEVAPPYRLQVEIDGVEVVDERVEPGGLRGDRPLIVDRQIELPPGPEDMVVRFSPVVDVLLEESLTRASVTLPSYVLEQNVELVADRILLVTLNDATGALEIYGVP
ncbi:MAG: hypothetical protein GY769_16730 [bacterium]|nr:hypothetical protein [bacterium]